MIKMNHTKINDNYQHQQPEGVEYVLTWQDPAPSNGETEGVHVHVGHEVQILLQHNFGQERKNLKSSKFNNGNSVQRKKERKKDPPPGSDGKSPLLHPRCYHLQLCLKQKRNVSEFQFSTEMNLLLTAPSVNNIQEYTVTWNVSVRVPDARPSAAFVHSAFVLQQNENSENAESTKDFALFFCLFLL